MALTNEELQDILSRLSEEEQRQLFKQLGKKFDEIIDKPDKPERTLSNHKKVSKEDSKVYCCIKCGSTNYKKNGFTSTGMQRYRCNDCNGSWSENYGDSLRCIYRPDRAHCTAL